MKIFSKSFFFFALSLLSILLVLFADYLKVCLDALSLSNGVGADAVSCVIPMDQGYDYDVLDIIHAIEGQCDSFSIIKQSQKNYMYCYSRNNRIDVSLTEGSYFSSDDFLLHRNVALVCETLKPRLSHSGSDYTLELDGCNFVVTGFYKKNTNSVNLQPDAIINMSADMISMVDKASQGVYYLQTSNSEDTHAIMHILQTDFNALEGELPIAKSFGEMLTIADGISFFSKTMRRLALLLCFAFMILIFVSEHFKIRDELLQRWICGATLRRLRNELYFRHTVSLSLPAVCALCVCVLLPQYFVSVLLVCLLWVLFTSILAICFNLSVLRGKINE